MKQCAPALSALSALPIRPPSACPPRRPPRHLLAFVDVNGVKQRDTGDGANRDRDYVSFIARLEWEFRRRWWLGAQYRFIYDEQTDFSGNDLGSYQDHRLLMTVKYRTLPWRR